jgi:thioredoxin 1
MSIQKINICFLIFSYLKKRKKQVRIIWGKKMSFTITNDNFQTEVLESPLPVLIDFWAPWCGPCRMLGPVIDQIADEYEGRVKIGKVNIDENGALADKHGIVSIPTLVLYNNGEMTAQKNGTAPKHDIISLFKNLL